MAGPKMWWYTADWVKTFRLWGWITSWVEIRKVWIWDGFDWDQLIFDSTPGPVASVQVSPANAGTLSTFTPNAVHFIATAKDANDYTVIGQTFTWSNDSLLDLDPSTVDSDGWLSTGDAESNRHVFALADGTGISGGGSYSVS